MDSQARNPADTPRLRLVDLRVDGEHLLHFGGGFSCVLAGNGNRTMAARAIAYTIVGPRPSGASGAIDLDGSLVSVWSLPTPLLPRDAPVVVDPDLVRSLWQESAMRRRGELAAAHATGMLEAQRIEAALDALGAHRADVAENALPRAIGASDGANASDQDQEVARFMESVKTYGLVESLIAGLEPEPLPEALHLAELVDANAALTRQHDEIGDGVDVDFEAAERRLKLARIEAALTSGTVGPEHRFEIERRHRAVVEAEQSVSHVGPRRRARAVARYDAAVAAEQTALAHVGIDSYAIFLMALSAGEVRHGPEAQQAAAEELTAASAAFATAQRLRDLPSRTELDTRARILRDHARTLLGREPGRDLSTELRSLRVKRADYDERLRELVRVLQSSGTTVGNDPVADARRFLLSPPSIQIGQQREWPMPGARRAGRLEEAEAFPMPGDEPRATETPVPPEPVAGPSALELAQIEALEDELADQRQRVAGLEAEMRGLEAARYGSFADLSPEALTSALECTLAAYRAGDVLAGKVPLVLDGVLDRLRPESCEAAVQLLVAATDIQSIVVSNDPQVMQCIRHAGGTIVRWPEPETLPTAPITR
jgi:hypothetical protein